MRKLIKMIESGDAEMHKLASTILNINRPFRLSFFALAITQSLITVLFIAFTIFCGYRGAGWYMIPLVMANLLQMLWSFGFIVTEADERTKYDKLAKWVSDAGN